MKPDENKLRAVLEDVVPASAESCGPGCGSVLEMVRHERARRKRASAVLTAAASIVLALTAVFWVWPRQGAEPAALAAAAETPGAVINSVNDEQLFALLQGTPAALMEWPNGDRTLLVVVGHQ